MKNSGVWHYQKNLIQKRKIILCLLGVILLGSIILGVSYAYWKITHQQRDFNTLGVSCFEVTLTNEENDIQFENASPITDEEGMELTPYTFTITNTCDTYAHYEVNLEDIYSSDIEKRLSYQYIKASLDGGTPQNLKNFQEVEPTLPNADRSFKLTSGTLAPTGSEGDQKTYELRLWMDYDTPPLPETMNAIFRSKISVVASYVEEETLQNNIVLSYESKTEGYSKVSETVEILGTSENYNIIEISDDGVTFTPVSPSKEIRVTKEYTKESNPTFYVRDEVGNIKKIDIVLEHLDQSGPEIIATPQEEWGTTNTISIELKDEKSGLSGYQITMTEEEPSEWKEVSGNTTTVEEVVNENKTYYIWSKDVLGNIHHTSVTVNHIDENGPVIDFKTSSSAGNLTVDASSSYDNETSIVNYEYSVDGGSYYPSETSSYTFTGLSHGTHIVSVRVTDEAGNSSEKTEEVFVVANSVLAVNPNGGSWNGSSSTQNVEREIGTIEAIPEPSRAHYDFLGWDITGGSSLSNYGTSLYTDESFANGTNSMSVYNNSSNGTVVHERVARSSDSPIKDSSYMMKITTSGTASPGLGGFVQITSSKLLGTFYHVIVAKIPVGYTLNQYNNAVGTGETFTWLTPRAGTGKFETYIYKLDCGTAGSFSSFGHVALTGPAATSSNPVTWYVAYSTVLDATAGTKLNTDVNFASGMNGMTTYNNAGNGTTSLSRIARSSDSPLTGASYMVRVTNTGSARPGLGGFYQSTNSRAKGVYYHTVMAKVPLGYRLGVAANSLGTGSSQYWLTPNEGTGEWEKYIYRTNAGTSGTFSTHGFVYLDGPSYGSASSPVTWDVGYASVSDSSSSIGNYSSYVYEYGTSDSTITAKWTPSTYTITYNANGGSGAPAAQSYTYDASGTINLSSTKPTRKGYTFLGWSQSSSATSASYSAGQAWKRSNASNYTLYAVWRVNTYTITYNANGGSGAPAAQSYTYATSGSINLSSTKPTRAGYTFQGWSQSSSASSASYQPGQAWSRSNASNYTLYAVWKTVPASTITNMSLSKQSCTNSGGNERAWSCDISGNRIYIGLTQCGYGGGKGTAYGAYVDLTNYTKATFNISEGGDIGAGAKVGFVNGPQSGFVEGNTTVTLDVTNYSGSYRIYLYFEGYVNANYRTDRSVSVTINSLTLS